MNPNDAAPMNTTELAVERSRLAADRTLMAWIRTSLSMISFGFTIFKFFQYIVESGSMQARWGGNGPRHMGSVLVILGTLLLVPATLQYRSFIRMLEKQMKTKFPMSLVQWTAAFIALIGLGALANFFFHFGPF